MSFENLQLLRDSRYSPSQLSYVQESSVMTNITTPGKCLITFETASAQNNRQKAQLLLVTDKEASIFERFNQKLKRNSKVLRPITPLSGIKTTPNTQYTLKNPVGTPKQMLPNHFLESPMNSQLSRKGTIEKTVSEEVKNSEANIYSNCYEQFNTSSLPPKHYPPGGKTSMKPRGLLASKKRVSSNEPKKYEENQEELYKAPLYAYGNQDFRAPSGNMAKMPMKKTRNSESQSNLPQSCTSSTANNSKDEESIKQMYNGGNKPIRNTIYGASFIDKKNPHNAGFLRKYTDIKTPENVNLSILAKNTVISSPRFHNIDDVQLASPSIKDGTPVLMNRQGALVFNGSRNSSFSTSAKNGPLSDSKVINGNVPQVEDNGTSKELKTVKRKGTRKNVTTKSAIPVRPGTSNPSSRPLASRGVRTAVGRSRLPGSKTYYNTPFNYDEKLDQNGNDVIFNPLPLFSAEEMASLDKKGSHKLAKDADFEIKFEINKEKNLSHHLTDLKKENMNLLFYNFNNCPKSRDAVSSSPDQFDYMERRKNRGYFKNKTSSNFYKDPAANSKNPFAKRQEMQSKMIPPSHKFMADMAHSRGRDHGNRQVSEYEEAKSSGPGSANYTKGTISPRIQNSIPTDITIKTTMNFMTEKAEYNKNNYIGRSSKKTDHGAYFGRPKKGRTIYDIEEEEGMPI